MPTQTYKLTWIGDSNRWRKIFRGQTFYFPLKTGESMKSSYQRCLAEWDTRRKELIKKTPKETPEQREHRAAIEKWRMVRDWHAKGLDGDLSKKGYDDADAMVTALQQRLKKGNLQPLSRFESDPVYGISQAGQWVWMDREKQMKLNGKPIEGTIAGVADHFIKTGRISWLRSISSSLTGPVRL